MSTTTETLCWHVQRQLEPHSKMLEWLRENENKVNKLSSNDIDIDENTFHYTQTRITDVLVLESLWPRRPDWQIRKQADSFTMFAPNNGVVVFAHFFDSEGKIEVHCIRNPDDSVTHSYAIIL